MQWTGRWNYLHENEDLVATRRVSSVRACCPASVIHLVGFASGSVLAPVAGDVASDEPLRHDAEMSEVQINLDRLVAQLSSVRSECDTWRSLARVRRDDNIYVQTSLDLCKDEF